MENPACAMASTLLHETAGEGEGAATGLLPPPVEEAPAPRKRRRRAGGGPPRPPRGGGGGGGGGGGDGEPPERPGDAIPLGPAELALGLVLTAVVTLFGVFAATFLLMRKHSPTWPPAGFPGVPRGLWVSTGLVLASSAALARAQLAARAGAHPLPWLLGAIALGVAFVAAQAWLWVGFWELGVALHDDAYATAFYSLTFLHALHVVAGILYLLRALARLAARHAQARATLRLGAVYWHFVGGVWLGLFALLELSV